MTAEGRAAGERPGPPTFRVGTRPYGSPTCAGVDHGE